MDCELLSEEENELQEHEPSQEIVQMRLQTKALKQELDKVHQQDVDDLFKIKPIKSINPIKVINPVTIIKPIAQKPK
jgi:hypothetical protein